MNIEKQLKEIGIKPVGGQHFLNDETTAEALVESAEADNKKVVEIGSGTGFITEKILVKANEVIAVEKDHTLAQHLREKFSSSLKVLEKDFLSTNLECDRYIGNIPFEISSDIIEKIGEEQVQASLIVQKELAEKIVAEPEESSYGPFSVRANYYFIPVKLRDVSRKHYYPKPEVDTSVVKLYPNKKRHGVENEGFFFKTVRALFTHKRKKVRNAFVDARHIFDIEKDRAKEIRDELPYSEERVNSLNVKKFAEISEHLAKQIP